MFIFSNLAISLDGKIAPSDRKHFYLGSPADRKRMHLLRGRSDAVLIGASTLRAFRGPLKVRGARHHPVNVIVSSTLDGVSPRWSFFTSEEIRRILFVGYRTPASRLKRFASRCDIEVLNPGKATAPQIVRSLARRGIDKLLVEGGGSTMWDFVEHDLIDEFHVTLTPWILGGTEAPTLVDGAGFKAKDALRLKRIRSRVVGDEIFLTYRR